MATSKLGPDLIYNIQGSGATVDNAYGVFTNFAEVAAGGNVPTVKRLKTKAVWGDSTGELLTFYTSSAQSAASKVYYYEIWNSSSLTCDPIDVKMFSVSYGHYAGSGSVLSSGGEAGDTPTKAIYGQYRTVLLENSSSVGDATGFPSLFTNADGSSIEHFYVVNFNRDRIGDKIDPGNFELNLVELDGPSYANNVYTGSNVAVSSSNKVISLIDDSGDASDSLGYVGLPSPERNLVSGSITNGIYNPTAPHYYGKVYLDKCVILIDAAKLNESGSFNTVTGSNIAGDNSFKLFTSISGSGALGANNGFFARNVTMTESAYYYVRVFPSSLNYSNNPTFTYSPNDREKNTIRNTYLRNDPTIYVSSIGLYDNNYDLVAVAKMSQPIKKDFYTELSVTVRLEY